jgi:glycosyltransferase involved in cell wall biosynthesis
MEWVRSTYSILEAAAESGSEPDIERLDRIRSRYDEAERAYGPVLAEIEAESRSTATELQRSSAEISRLSEELEAQRRSSEVLADWTRHLERSRSWRITRPLRALGVRIRRLLGRSATQPELPPVSQATSGESPSGVGAGSAQLAREPGAPSRERLVAWIEHLEGSRSWRITRPLRNAGNRVRLLRRRTRQPESRQPSETAAAALRSGAADRSMASEQMLIEWIRQLEGSRSWRITRPLRSVASFGRRVLRRPSVQPEPPAGSTEHHPAESSGAPAPVDGSQAGPVRHLTVALQIPALEPAPQRIEPLVQRPADEVVEQIRVSTTPGPDFEEFDAEIAAGRDRLAKLIAFYLPQFHAIPENDAWWGTGFTDWRNVVRGTPRFAGHYQPRIPRDLGFYDLSDPATIRRQTELAREAGLHGFAFYYFSFGGRRLLERPLERFLSDRSIDFPFCVTWANENWTRRWDGLNDETLLRLDHTPDDDAAMVDDIQRHFEDPRYIRIQGRPLFLVYRFDVLPQARETVHRWRELWEKRHGEKPLIFMVQSFEDDPRPYGADGAVEFPPQRLARWDNTISSEMHFFDAQFAGYVIDYESLVTKALQKQPPPFTWIRGVTPSWDNDARRQGGGTILHGSTPELYERWLGGLIDSAQEHPALGEPFVFVNAWNEWAEGAYLEPDLHCGAAYLNATARAVSREKAPIPAYTPSEPEPRRAEKTKVLLVGHDAYPHGAQMNLRGLGERLKTQFGCEVAYLLFEGGPLTADYAKYGEVHVCEDPGRIGPIARRLRNLGYGQAVVNTLAAAEALPPLKEAGFRAVSLVSEMPGVIRMLELESAAETAARHSNAVVFPAAVVAEAFSEFAEVPPDRTAILPQGLAREKTNPSVPAEVDLRSELGIPADARVVLNVGYADQRKGIDLFLETAGQATADAPNLHFVWLGNLNAEALELRARLERSAAENVHFAPFTEDISPYLDLADVFYLSSREDPFPSVVLEAMDAGLPVVAFRNSGGIEPLAETHGALVDEEDVTGALAALRKCATQTDPDAAEERRRVVQDRFQYDAWAFDVLRLLDRDLRKISVVVPNYNYADYLAERMESIFRQTHPIFELIVLDDGSTDGSLGRLEQIRTETGRRFRVIRSEASSGSVFMQWRRASQLARGELLWIAEADDGCKPEFLERLIRDMQTDTAFAFSDSAQIDQGGAPLASSYKDYYRRSANGVMQADFVLDGDQFVRSCLVERNLVLNVSAVVWNLEVLKETLDRCLDELLEYKLAGDWHLYAATALNGKRVAYVADPLNVHRRHENGVTNSLDKELHLEEVRRVHSRLVDWLQADPDERARMEAYETELKRQFGARSS